MRLSCGCGALPVQASPSPGDLIHQVLSLKVDSTQSRAAQGALIWTIRGHCVLWESQQVWQYLTPLPTIVNTRPKIVDTLCLSSYRHEHLPQQVTIASHQEKLLGSIPSLTFLPGHHVLPEPGGVFSRASSFLLGSKNMNSGLISDSL